MALSDDFIQQVLPTARPYCVFILKAGTNRNQPDAEQIQWEHVKYLMQLRYEGKLSVTCPVIDDTDLMGVGILNTADLDEAKSLLDEDPNIKAGRLVYDVHTCMGFPGDTLAE